MTNISNNGGAPLISIVLPAFNETEANLEHLIAKIQGLDAIASRPHEIIIVDDGSSKPISLDATNTRVVRHPYNMGNGAAIKTGARFARSDILVFMDADGQHAPADIPRLLDALNSGYDMAVGARAGDSHASFGRRIANNLYNRLASVMTGYRIEDLTSGFRAVRARTFRRFLYLLPNGFSYPTTSTMAFFRSGYPVAYVPIRALQRSGKSKISLAKDGLRFFVIILKIGALFSPMRLFLPISGSLFLLGLVHYGYTFFTQGRFTNMSALLFIASMFTFLIGIVSEQVSSLHYKTDSDEKIRETESQQ